MTKMKIKEKKIVYSQFFFYEEAATGVVSIKKVVLKIHRKTPVSECLIFNKA